MGRITASITKELANGVRDVLRQAASVVSGNQGDYIANGAPESVYGKIQLATARQYCRRFADDPTAYGDRTRIIAENICRPYLDDILYGSLGGPDVRPPFLGGQCDAQKYQVAVNGVGTSGSSYSTVNRLCFGPIGGARTFEVSPNTFQVQIFCRGISSTTNSSCGNPISLGASDWYNANRGGSLYNPNLGATASVTSVTICSGSDNCGNSPPDIVEPPKPTPPRPTVEPFNPSPDINISINVDIDVDGSVDIDFGVGPVTIDPFADDPTGEPGRPPGDIGNPGSPTDVLPGTDAEGDAPPGNVITALKVNILSTGRGAREFSPGIWRAVCYAYLGTTEGLDLDPAGALLSDGQIILPEKENLTRWKVQANPGYTLRVTPFYSEV